MTKSRKSAPNKERTQVRVRTALRTGYVPITRPVDEHPKEVLD